MWKKIAKSIGLAVLVFIVGGIAFVWYMMRPVLSFNERNIPRNLITAQFIDFDRVYMISKFRSAAGHDFSHGVKGETCRSMKHYFNVSKFNNAQDSQNRYRSQPTAQDPNINIYAPFDGKIKTIETGHTGMTVTIYPDKYPSYRVRIFHIDVLPGIKFGTHVKSGQQIGTIGPKDGTDFSVEAFSLTKGTILLSYFDVMTDEIFMSYADLGFRREDFVISKEYRNAHPFMCGVEQTNSLNKAEETFRHVKDRSWTEDYVYLREDPYPQPGQSAVRIGPPER